MKKVLILLVLSVTALFADFEKDTIATADGDLNITFIGHGTLYFEWKNIVVHVDPWSRLADYSSLPKADVILITHQHGDHLDPAAIQSVSGEKTIILLTQACTDKVSGQVMKNGEMKEIVGLTIKAVPAYNIRHKRDGDQPFHPKGEGNGYVITFGDVTVYVAGDTENVPEMADLTGTIDIAFLPMNLPYTMSLAMAADAANMIAPKILYPYHFGDTDVQQLVNLLKDDTIDVRIRKMP